MLLLPYVKWLLILLDFKSPYFLFAFNQIYTLTIVTGKNCVLRN